MKIKELRNFIKQIIKEAAADGVYQSRAKKSYAKMIRTMNTGGNKNTPPFSNKTKSKKIKSAPPTSGD
tara:strand:+ start:326 stop:529 length:204 start_codon:yes stop_codon:yes gene_type:complete